MGGWPDGLKKFEGAQPRESSLGPSRGSGSMPPENFKN